VNDVLAAQMKKATQMRSPEKKNPARRQGFID
jgi:hypothetical protein